MEQGSRENAVFQFTRQSAYRIIGTQGGLKLLVLRLWNARYLQQVGWDQPLSNRYFAPSYHDPYQTQLKREAFDTLLEAKTLIERWRQYTNRIRPHSALGYRLPAPKAWQAPCVRFGCASLSKRTGLVYWRAKP